MNFGPHSFPETVYGRNGPVEGNPSWPMHPANRKPENGQAGRRTVANEFEQTRPPDYCTSINSSQRVSTMSEKATAAVIGGGVIGSGWAARFVLSGWNVMVLDPSPEAETVVLNTMERARRSSSAVFDTTLPSEGKLEFADTIEDAVEQAAWIQESIPETLEHKRQLYDKVQQHSRPGSVIASSTSGFKPSDLQAGARRPGEIIVAHPFNPVYLLPVVEVVRSDTNNQELVNSALSILGGLGMFTLQVRAEIDAHLGDRFLEAVWREALWLVKDDIATTAEIDDVIRMGFGLRWAQMGLFETCRIAGGSNGMEHFLEQFGPCLGLPWTRLTEVPELDSDLIGKISRQSDEQSGGHSIEELEDIRDANLVTILRSLKARNWGAGKFLREFEQTVTPARQSPSSHCPMITASRVIPLDWADYNGHMNEARYLEIFSLATDAFLEAVGCDQEYVAGGGSYFTLETSIRHLGEVFPGQRVRVNTWCLFGQGKKLHLYHILVNDSDVAIATGEHLLIHIDLSTRKSSEPKDEVSTAIEDAMRVHALAQLPEVVSPKLSFKQSGAVQ